jgi:hypothetical protein
MVGFSKNNARDFVPSYERRHGRDKPPPQCRWGAFENPQFKWVPETLEGLETSSKEPMSVPYGFNVGSPKGSPLVEHGRGFAWITRQNYCIRGELVDQDESGPRDSWKGHDARHLADAGLIGVPGRRRLLEPHRRPDRATRHGDSGGGRRGRSPACKPRIWSRIRAACS